MIVGATVMQLVDLIEEVLQTGVLPMQVERKMTQLLATAPLDESAVAAIDALLDALCQGAIQPIARR